MSKMNTKDKDNKTLQDKLKQFFRINKGNPWHVTIHFAPAPINILSSLTFNSQLSPC